MDGAGVPVEFSKGEAGRGQHEINLRYSDALEMADRHVIYKNGAKEIAGLNDRSLTFMAKYAMDECGSSCHLHSSLWDADGSYVVDVGRRRPRAHVAGVPRLARRPDRAHAASSRGCSPRPSTPTSATSPSRGRRPRWRGVATTAPAGTAWSGTGRAYRVENRIPGADCNPYLAFAATIAAGLDGIEHGIEPPPRFEGNAYEAHHFARVPWNIVDAIDELEKSELAVKAFGSDVHYPPREHREAGVGRVQPGRHRLGAAPLLRAVLR